MIQPMFFPESRDGKVSGDHHASPCAGVGPNDHTVDYRPGLFRRVTRCPHTAQGEFVPQILE